MTDPLDDLQEQFRAAAARDIASHQAASRKKKRRLGVGLGIALAASGGLAAATQLISTGKPLRDRSDRPERYSPSRLGRLAVTAPDPGQPLPWGVVVYQARSGQPCAVAGLARGGELGKIIRGSFRPYERRTSGVCGSLKGREGVFSTFAKIDDRTLVYGRAASRVKTVEIVKRDGTSLRARTGYGGAFLFVLKDADDLAGVRFVPLDVNGRPASWPRP